MSGAPVPQVMLVDDSEADLLYTQIMLQRCGQAYAVRAYETAREALAALQAGSEPVDLILLDINMPGMNGFEFLQAYQHWANAQQRSAAVVMLTSSPDPADCDQAMGFAAVRAYLTKPLSREQAAGLVQHLNTA